MNSKFDIIAMVMRHAFIDDRFMVEGDNYGAVVRQNTPFSIDVTIYTDIKDVGKRGKIVSKYEWQIWWGKTENRTAWDYTLIDKLKNVKDFNDVKKEVDNIIEQMKSELGEVVQARNSVNQLKGVSKEIPEPSWLNVVENKKGREVGINYKKPYISIWGEKEIKKWDESRQIRSIRIPWVHVKKVNVLSEDLINSTTVDDALKILSDNGIRYEDNIRIDPMWA